MRCHLKNIISMGIFNVYFAREKFMALKRFLMIGFVAAVLVACGDDDSVSVVSSDDSSSSVEEESSSSSVMSSSDKSTSSTSSLTSSSIGSSLTSSSSEEQSSTNETETNSSSSVSGLSSSSWEGLDWSLTKEAYLNPEIEYDTIIDSRDSKVYKTVKIGEQVWMAENLNFDPGQGGSGENKYDWSWCYENEPKNCDVAGRLYTWAATMDSAKTGCGYGSTCSSNLPVQGICPSNWHLPSVVEWNVLIKTVGGESIATKVLKSQIGWNGNEDGADAFGFSALCAGTKSNSGSFTGLSAHFWSAAGDYAYNAQNMGLGDDFAFLGNSLKNFGFSVRCVKD